MMYCMLIEARRADGRRYSTPLSTRSRIPKSAVGDAGVRVSTSRAARPTRAYACRRGRYADGHNRNAEAEVPRTRHCGAARRARRYADLE